MNIKIIVATHKKYRMPEESMYLPIHAGHIGKNDLGYIGDDTGDNISDRNWYYSELSAIYWAWKNLDADVIGVTHYRRHFTTRNWLSYHIKGKWNSIITQEQLEKILNNNDIVVAKRRNYLIETNESHYNNGHDNKEIPLMRNIIKERCPDYLSAYDAMWKRNWAHMFNMFIMKKDKFDQFCSWWFDIMFEYEKRIDMTGYEEKERRAFMDERMMDVWLIKNDYPYKELNVMYMEKQNWVKKIKNFLLRKFFVHHNIWD
ncbi:MAG: DUF4422 domain-containing protein [Clostridiales bacterium]|nr:DUF4422 domain-containing protein [Clostridiales bacterium]